MSDTLRLLGRVLFESIERADPSQWPMLMWDDLSQDEQDFYVDRIRDLLEDHRELAEQAIGEFADCSDLAANKR